MPSAYASGSNHWMWSAAVRPSALARREAGNSGFWCGQSGALWGGPAFVGRPAEYISGYFRYLAWGGLSFLRDQNFCISFRSKYTVGPLGLSFLCWVFGFVFALKENDNQTDKESKQVTNRNKMKQEITTCNETDAYSSLVLYQKMVWILFSKLDSLSSPDKASLTRLWHCFLKSSSLRGQMAVKK